MLLTAGTMAACSPASGSTTESTHPTARLHAPTPGTTRQSAAPARRAASSRSTAQGGAAAMLATLPVKGRAPKTGYDRNQFGQAWSDVDHNGCDTRNDVLHRDMSAITTRAGTRDCIVTSGTLRDPYTGTVIRFTRGERTSPAVQIDHLVALSDAWQTGAQGISAQSRLELANDPLNLLAVDGPTNESKSDGDAATWLPPNKAFRCQYVARQVAVKHKYRLWVTSGEHDAIAGILSGCRGQAVPTDAAPQVTWAPHTTAPTAPRPTRGATAHASASGDGEGADTYYKSCAAVRAAGVAPLRRGEAGYRSGLDRDGDGVACE